MSSPFRDIPSLGIIEGAEQDADDVDNLPDEESSTCQNLQNAWNDFPRVNTVQSTATRAEQQTG